jgi:hypothetical protein
MYLILENGWGQVRFKMEVRLFTEVNIIMTRMNTCLIINIKFTSNYLLLVDTYSNWWSLNMSILLFWVVTLYGLVGRYQRFREIFCLHCPASSLKMETVFFSETLVSTYKSTWWHNPEEHQQSILRLLLYLLLHIIEEN